MLLVDAHLARHAGRLEAAVASRGAIADDLAFADDDAQTRVAFGEAVRGPEAGQSTASDCHIDLLVAGKRVARIERLGQASQPAGHLPVALIRRRAREGLGRNRHALSIAVNFLNGSDPIRKLIKHSTLP